MNRKLYIHELIDVIGHNRARYMHHMTANWCPVGKRERNMSCFGVWATVGSTGAWPQVVNLWELSGWKGLAVNFEHELVGGGAQDPSLAEWWAVASELRRGGFDRIVAPERWSPTIDELTKSGVKGSVYAHEIVRSPIGGARAFLDALAETGRPAVEELGLTCVGAFRVMMATDSEAIVIWAIPDLNTWAAFERAWDRGALAAWRHRLVALGTDVQRTLMVDAPLSPMRIGRQPAVSDRLPLSEIGPVTGSLGSLLDGDPADVVAYLNGSATTRAELRAAADGMATRLRVAGLEAQRIGVLAPNAPGAIAAWFAVWSVGGAFVPFNPRVPAAERERLIASTGVTAVIEPPVLNVIAGAPAGAIDAGEAIIQFTSGTTGRPKAVPLRHDTVLALLDGVIGSLRAGRSADPRTPMPNLVPVSLSLWAGIYQVLFAFRLGAAVVLMERFEPAEFARLVAEYGIRSSVLPPAAMVMLARDANVTTLEPLRYVRSVSAPLSPVHARHFHDRFGVAILNGYGQTELGGEVVGWTAADWKEFGAAKLGAVGRPHAGIEVRVRNGELEVRSRSAAPDPAALGDRGTDDGWLRTGDLARIDDDGFVWIDGRVSAMVNRGGLKVFPDEVEEHVREHPAIADAAVAGVPDDRLGEVPWAFVVMEPGTTIDAGGLQEWCRPRMAAYKVPAGVTIVEQLPRNEIGKLLRQDLVPLAEADR